ncbi:MAG: hypothetical protein WCX77_04155 [Candidatus Paceibacterota bacterium]|jgi:hypothetical protein
MLDKDQIHFYYYNAEGSLTLQRCKRSARALKYLEIGNIPGAWTSMLSDLKNNEELAVHPAIELGTMLLFAGSLTTKEAMKEFIEGFE